MAAPLKLTDKMADGPMAKDGDPSSPALIPVGTRRTAAPVPVTRPFILIGSRNRSHLHLVSKTISRNHACLIRGERGYYLRDLASRTGVIVNGRRVKETDLRDGDSVEIGSFRFMYTCPALSADSQSVSTSAALSVNGGTVTPLEGRTFLIGRRGKSDISLTGTEVSKSHALLFQLDARHFVRDLGSRTGTFVNGEQVRQRLLEFGDEIRVGDTIFRYLPLGPGLPDLPVDEPCNLGEPSDSDDPLAITPAPAPAREEPPPPRRIRTEERSIPIAFDVPSPETAAVEQQPGDSEPEELAELEEFDDDTGPVPMRGADGQPIYIRMHVTNPLFYFPALADYIDPRQGG